MENIYKRIADSITENALTQTSNGSYITYFESLAEEFEVTEEWIKEHAEDIENEFDFDIVAECVIEDDCFDMMFYLQYCCEHCGRYQEGKRCWENCSSCECWCDSMDEEEE